MSDPLIWLLDLSKKLESGDVQFRKAKEEVALASLLLGT